MPFHFALETVLHFRRSIEHQQELRLRVANQQVARMRRMIEHIEQQAAGLRLRKSDDLNTGTTVAELEFGRACEAALAHYRVSAERELQRLEQLREEQNKVFQQARRERETFESLRERRRIEYERDARRRAQRELDELFLLRNVHRRG
jgi:flagellar export protein FliJ